MTSTSTLHKTVYFQASKETVWAFLTERDKLGAWYHKPDEDLRDGAPYVMHRLADDGAKVRTIWGRVVMMNRPDELVTTFEIPSFDGKSTTLTWHLEEAGGGTRLSLTHEGIAEAAGAAVSNLLSALDKGWDEHFAALRTAVNA